MMGRLKAENVDLLLTEYFDPCGLAVGQKLGIKKHITIYSMPMPKFGNQLLGLPNSLSFVPDLYASLTPKMTMFERFKNVFSAFFMYDFVQKPLFNGVELVTRELVDPNFDFMVKFTFEKINQNF